MSYQVSMATVPSLPGPHQWLSHCLDTPALPLRALCGLFKSFPSFTQQMFIECPLC